MIGFRTTSFAAVLVATAAASAAGQEGACRIDYGRPGQVKDARNAVLTTEVANRPPEEARKNYARAVTLLTREPDRLRSNMIGRNAVLGHALVNLALLPDTPDSVRRADVGYTSEPDAMVDLLTAADSALDAVEAENPACKEETEGPRRRAYAELVNAAVNEYNERNIDAAEAKVRRGLMLYDDYPLSYLAYNVLGNIQQTRDDITGAVTSFTRMVDLMGSDTSFTAERKNTIMVVNELMQQQADALEGEAKTAKANELIAFLEKYSREYPDDVKLQAAVAMAQLRTGNTEAAGRLFNDMINSPEKYTDVQIMEAGVTAARANENTYGAQLFEAALKKNPYSRDALFNLAAIYDADSQFTKMPPVLERLLNVDPENPDNYQLLARYWQARARTLRDSAQGKEPPDPVAVAWETANNELLKAYTRMQDAPVRVSFNLFSHDGGRHILAGNVENRTDAEKTYSLKFEFLDSTGAVLESREVPVEAVGGKSSKSFRVELTDKPGVVAFRYAPLTG
ncbi:MAG TPA: FxLYD domain-containing protein [Gemmatimonadaceae bacterium]|nr:FxLYD domain-containing protein [Gemmatimonadaceae bacterium]